jgi:hypothetical protein
MERKPRTVELEIVGTDEAGKTIIELIESTGDSRQAPAEPAAEAKAETPQVPERIELVAEREIVLRCGDASLTLTRSGKILLRGTYVLSRASGVNKIKGGSVQIN